MIVNPRGAGSNSLVLDKPLSVRTARGIHQGDIETYNAGSEPTTLVARIRGDREGDEKRFRLSVMVANITGWLIAVWGRSRSSTIGGER